jgi:hypothetical protein
MLTTRKNRSFHFLDTKIRDSEKDPEKRWIIKDVF